MASFIVALRQGGVRSTSRSPWATIRRAAHLYVYVGDQVLGQFHDVGVVGVGTVESQHRELGVVPGGDPLVAEHATDLEHPLHVAHH